jgi:hypothetical protein
VFSGSENRCAPAYPLDRRLAQGSIVELDQDQRVVISRELPSGSSIVQMAPSASHCRTAI